MISTSFLGASPMQWEPYDGELPEQPYIARYADGLKLGLSFNEALYGKFAAASMARLRRKVEKRHPWRSPSAPRIKFDSPALAGWELGLESSYSLVDPKTGKSFNQLKSQFNIIPLEENNRDEFNALSNWQGSGSDWNLRRHLCTSFRALTPYVTKIYKRVMAERNCRKADELLESIEKRLSLSGSAGLGTLMLTENEEKLSEFAKKTASYLCHLIFSEFATPVTVSYVKNKRKKIIFSCEFPSEAALYVIKNYLGYSAADVAEKCDPDNGFGLDPFINRLKSGDFVLRRFRAIKRLCLADFLREYGFVNKAREPFIADALVSDRKHQKQRNDTLLKNMVVYDVNDTDNFHALADLVAKSTNNIDNRFYELLARFKGFAEYAEEFGFQGAMLTMTAPSRFHAFSPTGQPNQKWLKSDKPTARDGADWLAHHWALIQARLAKEGIRLFGFRFCEPHHDGTIHYHLAVWFQPDEQETVIKTFESVMLMEKEKGALKHRFNYILADKKHGAKGMIGYFLPYISKNTNGRKLNGHDECSHSRDSCSRLSSAVSMEVNEYGSGGSGFSYSDSSPSGIAAGSGSVSKGATPVERVDSWKCAYRFRQFSQIGGPSVTAWREMRRIRNEFNKDSSMFNHLTQAEWFALESVRAAADAGDWKQFCIAMGGVSVKRKKQTVTVQYSTPKAFEKILERLDKDFTEDFKKTRYGDTAKARVAGLNFPYVRNLVKADSDGFALKATMFSLFVKTRTTEWAVTDKQHFEKWKSRSLEFVSDQFEQLILAEEYQVMDEELYQRYVDLVDEQNSVFDRAILLDGDGIPEDWYPVFESYLDSPIAENMDFQVWAFADDAQGAALS